MTLTSGFFNSLSSDRLYDAVQMSSMFDGVFNDGIFENWGNSLRVYISSGMTVSVGEGRAWFDNTWTNNDAHILLTLDPADAILSRYDAIVLETNTDIGVRNNSIKIVKGTSAANPVKPTLTHTATVNQYALAYVHVTAGMTVITSDKLEDMVGSTETPYATLVTLHVKNSDIVDNTITAAKIANRVRKFFVPVTSMKIVLAGSNEIQEYINTYGYTYAFPDWDLRKVYGSFSIPVDWGYGNITVKAAWLVYSTAVGKPYFQFATLPWSVGTDLSTAMSFLYLAAGSGNPEGRHVQLDAFGSGFAATGGQQVNFMFARDGGNGQDTISNYVELLGLTFEYTADS